MKYLLVILFLTGLILLLSCSSKEEAHSTDSPEDSSNDSSTAPKPDGGEDKKFADVTAVTTSGKDSGLTFSVSVRSPDKDCDQYADWWEVLSRDGKLIFRRILNHSHVDEQPFTRDGGPVPIGQLDTVIVRAHMHPDGYGGKVMRGTAKDGFKIADDLPADFASDVEKKDPQPEKCLF